MNNNLAVEFPAKVTEQSAKLGMMIALGSNPPAVMIVFKVGIRMCSDRQQLDPALPGELEGLTQPALVGLIQITEHRRL